MTLYYDGETSLAKFETFLQRLLWENVFGPEVVVFRLKADVALDDGRRVIVQVRQTTITLKFHYLVKSFLQMKIILRQ